MELEDQGWLEVCHQCMCCKHKMPKVIKKDEPEEGATPPRVTILIILLIAAIVAVLLALAAALLVYKSTLNPTCSTTNSCIHQRSLEHFALSEMTFQQSIIDRGNNMYRRDLSMVTPWVCSEARNFWDFLRTSDACPYPSERIDTESPWSQWWVCGLHLFNKNLSSPACLVYAFGMGEAVSFYKRELFRRTNCTLFVYNLGLPNMTEYEGQVNTASVALGSVNKGLSRTLGTLMKGNGHSWIDFVQIDLYGGIEKKILRQIGREFDILPFGQLHLKVNLSPGDDFLKFFSWWMYLEGKGLRLFKYESNRVPCSDTSQEVILNLAFLNVKTLHRVLKY